MNPSDRETRLHHRWHDATSGTQHVINDPHPNIVVGRAIVNALLYVGLKIDELKDTIERKP